jgi:hypothetical protein
MEIPMALVLTYCTGKLLSHAILPVAVFELKPVKGANDDDPRARFLGHRR